MDAILLQILNGLDKGSAYALIALGLTLIFGTLGWWLEKRAGHRPYFRKFADTETTIAISH